MHIYVHTYIMNTAKGQQTKGEIEMTKTEYDVRYQFDGNANIEGAPCETLEEAREAFEAECATRDSRAKTVWLVRTECDYEGDECIEVRDIETIETRTV